MAPRDDAIIRERVSFFNKLLISSSMADIGDRQTKTLNRGESLLRANYSCCLINSSVAATNTVNPMLSIVIQVE